jgi:hypothetical protein
MGRAVRVRLAAEGGCPTLVAEGGCPTPAAEGGCPAPAAEGGCPALAAEGGCPTPVAEGGSPTLVVEGGLPRTGSRGRLPHMCLVFAGHIRRMWRTGATFSSPWQKARLPHTRAMQKGALLAKGLSRNNYSDFIQ